MGKGEIINYQGNGLYTVKIIYGGRTQFNNRIAILTAAIADLETRIANETDETQKKYLELEKAALEKSKTFLQMSFPDDFNIPATCADLTEDLSGDVGTIEIPGEPRYFNIQPGYQNNAEYDNERDGILWPAIAGSADWCYFNQCILPGWQKSKPTYRYGTIIDGSIDFDNDTCDVCIKAEFSSQQNLNVNQDQAIQGCADYEPSGFNQFCTDNPTHPLCTNTQKPTPLYVDNTLYQKIQEINLDINLNYSYQSDQSGWRTGEYWAIMSPGGSGDCEDFALTKAQALLDYGVNVQHLQIATCAVERGLGWHAVLMIQTQNRGVLILDNRYDEVLNKDVLQLMGYQWDTYQEAGHDWASFSTRLQNVPIEYMTCNSYAFADGDEVIIKFENQNWNNPKVIGFKTNPQICADKAYFFLGQPVKTVLNVEYDLTSNSFATKDIDQDIWPYESFEYRWFVTVQYNNYGWLLGGLSADDLGGFDWYWRPLNLVKAYYASTNTWYNVGSGFSGAKRGHSGGFETNAKAYVVGGSNYPEGPQAGPFAEDIYGDVDQFDLTTYTWSIKNSFSERFDMGGVEASDNYGYMAGGGSIHYVDPDDISLPTPHDDCDKYDQAGDSWISRQNFTNARWNHVTFEANGRLHISGGIFPDKNYSDDLPISWSGLDAYYTKNCQQYNHISNSWQNKNDLPFFDFRNTGSKNSSQGIGLVTDPAGAFQNFYCYKYNAETNSWSQSGPAGQYCGFYGGGFAI